MLIPKKASDELQCLLCGIDQDKTSLPMLDCENDNKLLSSIILGLNLQESINCKKLDLGFIRIVLCFNCHYILKFVNEFRVRSLLNIHQLRMKFYHENAELPEGVRTRSTAGVLSTDDDSNWLKIVNVESQYPEHKFQTTRSPKNSFHTNGYMGRSDISNGSIKSSKHSSRSSKNHNGHGPPESKNGFQGKCNNMVRRSRRLEDHADDESCARSTESRISLKHELIERFSENDFITNDEVDFQPGLNDSIDICDNEIRGINYNIRSSPMENIKPITPDLQRPSTPVRVHVGKRPSSSQQSFMMPELPLLKVLYATESEPLTETESGGRVDKENTLMGASSRKKSFKCSICDKTMRNELLLKKHLVSKHIHDKRRDMMERKKKKAADKKFACSTCHSTFRTAYMLKKHESSHKRLRCEMCNAEYTNPMDFEWHRAKCSGVNHSSHEHTGVWTRSRSRQNAFSNNNDTMMEDSALSEREQNSIAAEDIAAAETLISMERETPRLLTPPDQIPEENKEHLEKWLEHTKAQLQNRKKGKRGGRKKKTKVSMEQSNTNEILNETFDENVFIENEREIESTSRRIARASTPFPSRARRSSSVFDSASIESESRASTPASQVSSINLENWFRNRMEFDNDDSASVCSGYTAISDRSDITARTSTSFASSRRSSSSIGSSNWCARSRDSISTSISLLANKPRTRNVAKALQKLELELSFCSNRSAVDNASQKSHRRLKKRAHRRNDDSVNEYWCNDDYCERSYPTLEELMDHEEEAHKLLRLFRCGECKRKFTAKKFLQKHQLDHESGPFMCIYCDFNFTYTHELRTHFELHRMRSVPCEHPGCCKTFLKPVHLAEHQLTYHVKEVSAEEEELFVLEFQRKRALARRENRPIGKNMGILKSQQRRRSAIGAFNSATSETEAETQEQYARVLGEMHSSMPIQNLSAPGCSYTNTRDTTGFLPEVAQRIQSQRLSNDQYSSASEVIDTVQGVCDTIMNSDDNVADPRTNEYSTSLEDEDNEPGTSRSILVKKRRKKPRITLSSKRHRSRQIITPDHVERDLSFFDHPKYSDISGPETQDESDICEDPRKVKPWRL